MKSSLVFVAALLCLFLLLECSKKGCTYSKAFNYDSNATVDDGSCSYTGCMDVNSLNYNPNATIDDGSCIYNSELKDLEGNLYNTVIFSNGQEWMSENLRVGKYSNNDPISLVEDDISWSNFNSGAYCWYNSDSLYNNHPHGKLYNWYSVVDSRNICPSGWRIPNNQDWNKLIIYLDSNVDTSISSGWLNTNAGGSMKSTGFQFWLPNNIGATNVSGFNGLPSGWRKFDGSYHDINEWTDWWSIDEFSSDSAFSYLLSNYSEDIYKFPYNKKSGFSVRCIKD